MYSLTIPGKKNDTNEKRGFRRQRWDMSDSLIGARSLVRTLHSAQGEKEKVVSKEPGKKNSKKRGNISGFERTVKLTRCGSGRWRI